MPESALEKPEYPTLSSPPILEAIVSIDCQSPESIDIESIIPIAAQRFGEKYPILQRLAASETKFEFPVSTDDETRLLSQGFRVLDKDPPSLVLHFTEDNFSFNMLRPYQGLDCYLDSISQSWMFFRDYFKPEIVERIGLRYVNWIELPFTEGRGYPISEYFNLVPPLPEDGTQSFLGFFQTLRFMCKESGFLTQISFATEEPRDRKLPVLLDIESFTQVKAKPSDFEGFREIIDGLRNLKNKHFYSIVSSKCLELFQ